MRPLGEYSLSNPVDQTWPSLRLADVSRRLAAPAPQEASLSRAQSAVVSIDLSSSRTDRTPRTPPAPPPRLAPLPSSLRLSYRSSPSAPRMTRTLDALSELADANGWR